MLNIDDKYDKQTDKTRLTLEISKFLLYLITLIIAVVLAYNSLDKRLSVIESEMQHKVDLSILLEKLDIVKDEISKKIEIEVSKVNHRQLNDKHVYNN